MKKIIILYTLIISSIIFSSETIKNPKFCSDFRSSENKKKFNPYTGKTNINFSVPDGKYECKNVDTNFRVFLLRFLYVDDLPIEGDLVFEIKNRTMKKLEITEKITGELLFSAEYNQSGINGKMYAEKSFGFGNSHSISMTFKNDKPVGEFFEYYQNGNIYRKSLLRKKNNFHPFSTPDDYIDYVEYYEIYDFNSGKMSMENHIENKKLIYHRDYYDGVPGREYFYKK